MPSEDSSPEVVVVAMVAANGVIGDGADQPWHLREDQARFKALTMGHPLVMGRKTWEAIGRPLPGRPAVVVTRDPDWSHPAVTVANDPVSALTAAAPLPGGEQIMVIGGGQIYEALLPHATRLELTEVDADAPGSVRFPPLDGWREVARDDRLGFAFVTYRPDLSTRVRE